MSADEIETDDILGDLEDMLRANLKAKKLTHVNNEGWFILRAVGERGSLVNTNLKRQVEESYVHSLKPDLLTGEIDRPHSLAPLINVFGPSFSKKRDQIVNSHFNLKSVPCTVYVGAFYCLPDQRSVVVADAYAGQWQVWDVKDEYNISVLEENSFSPTIMAAPGGSQRIVSVGDDPTDYYCKLRLLDIESGKCLRTLQVDRSRDYVVLDTDPECFRIVWARGSELVIKRLWNADAYAGSEENAYSTEFTGWYDVDHSLLDVGSEIFRIYHLSRSHLILIAGGKIKVWDCDNGTHTDMEVVGVAPECPVIHMPERTVDEDGNRRSLRGKREAPKIVVAIRNTIRILCSELGTVLGDHTGGTSKQGRFGLARVTRDHFVSFPIVDGPGIMQVWNVHENKVVSQVVYSKTSQGSAIVTHTLLTDGKLAFCCGAGLEITLFILVISPEGQAHLMEPDGEPFVPCAVLIQAPDPETILVMDNSGGLWNYSLAGTYQMRRR